MFLYFLLKSLRKTKEKRIDESFSPIIKMTVVSVEHSQMLSQLLTHSWLAPLSLHHNDPSDFRGSQVPHPTLKPTTLKGQSSLILCWSLVYKVYNYYLVES